MDIPITEGIIIASLGGTFAGAMIWILQVVHEKATERRDKKAIIKVILFLNKEIGDTTKDDPKNGMSTEDLSYFTNLPLGRVRYICRGKNEIIDVNLAKKVFNLHNEPLEERWNVQTKKYSTMEKLEKILYPR